MRRYLTDEEFEAKMEATRFAPRRRGPPATKSRLIRVWQHGSRHVKYETVDGKQVYGPFVYFIRAGDCVKVGFTASDPETRLAILQTNNHEAAYLDIVIKGSELLEREWHERLAPDHVRGDWFRVTDELLAAVAPLRRLSLIINTHRHPVGADLGIQARAKQEVSA